MLGRSRSATIVIAYIMQLYKWNYDKTLAYV